MWCVAELDEKYIERMEDVLAVYEKPYDPAEPVVCLDEKPISLHAEVRPPRPTAPGHIAKRDNEYKRCGTANVFGVVEPRAGKHFTCATPNRSAAEFAKVVRRVVHSYPLAQTIHMVWDNLNIHCRKSLTDRYGESKGGQMWSRLTVHPTPKHVSGYSAHPRPENPPAGNALVEAPSESCPGDDQLEVRPQDCAKEVWLQETHFQAVRDLVHAPKRQPVPLPYRTAWPARQPR
jgi:hypothetical protein